MREETAEQIFDLDLPLPIPTDTTIFGVSERIVACAPSVARWVVLAHPLGESLLRSLLAGNTLRQAINAHEPKNQSLDVQSAMQELLGEIVDKDFLSSAKVHPDLVPAPYITLSIHQTNACNLQCVTCYRFSGEPNEQELDETDWLRLISEHYAIGGKIVKISGGEP